MTMSTNTKKSLLPGALKSATSTGTIRILALLALVQVALAAVLFFAGSGNNLANSTQRAQLFEFDNASVDKLVIRSKDETVELVKGDAGDAAWTTTDDFPANQGKITGLLDKLKELKTSFPVATSKSAYERFKLADDDFERHITLEQDDKALGSLYLGSGAGARRTHARYGDDPAVYGVNIGAYDTPAALDDWLDKSVLQLKADDLKTVALGEVEVEKVDGVWKVNKLPQGKLLDQKAIEDGLSPLLSLRFDKLLGKEVKPDYGLNEPEFALKLTHKDGERAYQIGKLKDGDDYVLKTSDRPEYFQLAAYAVKPLLEKLTVDKWFMPDDSTTKDEQETTGEKNAESESTQQ